LRQYDSADGRQLEHFLQSRSVNIVSVKFTCHVGCGVKWLLRHSVYRTLFCCEESAYGHCVRVCVCVCVCVRVLVCVCVSFHVIYVF
jgi:hypothetical protein